MSKEPVVEACTPADVEAIRGIYVDTYQREYPYRHFFDSEWLRKSVYSDSVLMLAARHPETSEVVGTASIVLDVGAKSDLLGEFGRLVVHPSARGLGIGSALMRARLLHAESRLHVALVEARTAHPYSQKIAFSNGFVPVGYLYQKHLLNDAESVVLGVRHFGAALELRKNHPRIVPEVKALAHLALEGCALKDDAIVDPVAAAYPRDVGEFEVYGLTVDGMPPVLRIQRGRTRQREVFGPTTLQHGFFKITQTHTDYLLARRRVSEEIVGAIGLLEDSVEHAIRIVELVFDDDCVVPFLIEQVTQRALASNVRYIEVDVSAHATRMQRTLIEYGFVPAAYVPAMVFDDVERLDAVRFTWVDPIGKQAPPIIEALARPVVDTVQAHYQKAAILPALKHAVGKIRAFDGATAEQLQRLYAVCQLVEFAPGDVIFSEGDTSGDLILVLTGRVEINRHGSCVGGVATGDLLGETSALTDAPHSVQAVAKESVTAARVTHAQVQELVRQRPDIGVVLYRNLALQLGKKLRQRNDSMVP